MSGSQPPRQILPAEAFRSLMDSPPALAAVAAACMLVFLFLPLVYVSSKVIGISAGGVSMSGSQMAGWTAWLGLIAFAAAAASRYLPQFAQYRSTADIAAFIMAGLIVIYLFMASPLASAAEQVSEMQSQLGGLMAGIPGAPRAAMRDAASFSVMPHIGSVFLVAAPIALFLARRRERMIAPVT